MTPLFLLRHGPTSSSRRGAPLGRRDLPVDPDGQALWPSVRAELLGLGLQRVMTSELQRARTQALDLGLPTLVLPGLNEQSFGDWEDLPWAENKEAEAFYSDPVRKAPPGGESFAHCASRALLAIQSVLQGEERTLVLAHGGSLRAILAHFMGLPLDRALDLAWQPYGLTFLEVYGPNKAVLRYHNRCLPICPQPRA